MAATAVNLSVPAPADDTMEMSSPGQHNLDEDIDFDDYQPDGGGVQMNDDDRMTDDNEQGRPGTATDDMMEDDMQQAAVQEAEMQDSPSHAQVPEDEELIDYSDDELQDEIVEDAGLPNTVEQPAAASTTELPDQDVDEEIVRPLGDLDGEHVTAKVDEATSVTEQAPVAQPAEEQIFTAQENAGNPKGFAGETNQPESTDVAPPSEDAEEQTQEHGGSGIEEQQPLAQTSASKLEISLDTSTQHVVEGPATPTDTGLHAMVVRYGEHRFPLFKSRNQPDGLLKNDNLASLSLGELIQNCRQRLALKTGDILSEDQDLVLGFEQLGLILVEVYFPAFAPMNRTDNPPGFPRRL